MPFFSGLFLAFCGLRINLNIDACICLVNEQCGYQTVNDPLYELEIKGYIIRSKADYIEGGEKNTKYFANLEKKDRMKKRCIN